MEDAEAVSGGAQGAAESGLTTSETKVCSGCRRRKKITLFGKLGKKRSSRCKRCISIEASASAARRRLEKLAAAELRHRVELYERLLQSAREELRRRHMTWTETAHR
jgi:hypothetical protein